MVSLEPASRARTRSRTASWTRSGTHTPVSSPARCSRANVTASRRFVLTRSPGRFGIRAGATGCVLISQPNPTGDSPMTTAKPPARYSAMESARSGDFATAELHHPSGHDLGNASNPVFATSAGSFFFIVPTVAPDLLDQVNGPGDVRIDHVTNVSAPRSSCSAGVTARRSSRRDVITFHLRGRLGGGLVTLYAVTPYTRFDGVNRPCTNVRRAGARAGSGPGPS